MHATYDADADAIYVWLRDDAGDRARAEELDESHIVDLDGEGRAIGVEILYPGRGMRLAKVAERAGVDVMELHQVIDQALMEAEAYAAPTRTASANAPLSYAVVARGSDEPRPAAHASTTSGTSRPPVLA